MTFEAPGLNINFLKKEDYTGSFNGIRFRLWKQDDSLKACIYPEPWSFENTPEENKSYQDFDFSPEGISEALSWIENYK